ncbi:EAL domain-containing protein [Egicoccus halophilus]|uniref:histidine kinase n=1 Tax=Egicoccus halophilus TaxID=1670830 RepID=A0A8J3AC40_9ACTN|nr:EAL domain-containing protein [Egicoccus halophilus]GGI08072.1 hypothetical protein GCM10011354_27260 [Egicoccus halophilus]
MWRDPPSDDVGSTPAPSSVVADSPLALAASGASLTAVLTAVVTRIETELPGACGSVLLLEPDGRLSLACAPSLPAAWHDAMTDGSATAADGTPLARAAATGAVAVSRDLAADPCRSEVIDVAVTSGLRACWSAPLVGPRGPLGVVGVHHRQARAPTDDERERLVAHAHMAAVAVLLAHSSQALDTARSLDPVTGLPVNDRLPAVLEEVRETVVGLPAVAAVEVGRLRDCNDAFGFEAGDQLLRDAAARLADRAGGDRRLLRGVGNVFLVVLDGPDEAALREAATGFAEALRAPFVIAGRDFHVASAVGLVLAESPDRDPAELARLAIDAMERGRSERGTVVVAGGAPRPATTDRLELEQDLRRALDVGEVTVHYQPQYDLHTGMLVGAEALVRWRHPDRGVLLPGRFLPVLEAAGLERELSQLVIDRVCRDLADWRMTRPGLLLPVSFNVSAAQLQDAQLYDRVADALAATGLPGSALVVEVTEQAAFVDEAGAAATLRRLTSLGVRIAIDDFGTGYSSLSHARRLPTSTLKIDRSFVTHIASQPPDAAVVAAICGLADGLGLTVVAEGIEDPEQLRVVRELGCHVGQGFHWSRALPPEEFRDLLPEIGPGPDAKAGPDGGWRIDVDRVVADLAHQTRTPLTIVSMYADLLAAADADPEVVAGLRRQVTRLTGVLSQTADAAALDRGGLLLARQPVALHAVLHELVTEGPPELRERIDLRHTDADVVGDPDRLRQLLGHLLDNVRVHAPASGPVRVAVTRHDTRVCVTVEDRGPGIPMSKAEHVFRKYTRLDPGAVGLGLGLFIARQLARHHGGELSYRPATPTGACFVLELPAAD